MCENPAETGQGWSAEVQKMMSRPRYPTHLVDYRFNSVRDSNTIKTISSEIRRRDAGKLSLLCFKRSTVYGNYHVTTRCERLRVGSELWYERLFLVCSSSCSIARALRILILTISISPFPSPLYPVPSGNRPFGFRFLTVFSVFGVSENPKTREITFL